MERLLSWGRLEIACAEDLLRQLMEVAHPRQRDQAELRFRQI
jgi:hypothetical protein